MPITVDCHIHSQNSCDDASLKVADLVRSAGEKGIVDYVLTDHVHTPFNLPDIAASRREYLACNPSPRFHFGVEVSVVSEWELREVASGCAAASALRVACARSTLRRRPVEGRNQERNSQFLTRGKYPKPTYGIRTGGPPGAPLAIGLRAEDVATYRIEYVVGGAHWPIYVAVERETVIRDYHRQNMFLAAHPLVDIVAHPWWWMKHWQDPDGMYRTDPWFDDFRKVPLSMHDEFAASAVQHGAIVEINLDAILLNRQYPAPFKRQYLDYLAYLKSRGVGLTVGSDCHAPQYTIDFEAADRMLSTVGIRDEDLWRPPFKCGCHI
jgi:histidinol phosphatase-like PHP family hydrolase